MTINADLRMLSRTTPATTAPLVNPAGAGILHLGLGSFHRAHQAMYTAAALQKEGGSWGIVGVASRSRTVVDALRAQDFLYSVATISPAGTTLAIPGVHSDAFVAADQPERVVAHIADPAIRIVTLTVTENGYSYSASTEHLDLDDPLVRADLAGGAPRSTIGQLARGLQARAAGAGEPLSVLSCDNLAANGKHTEKLVREFLQALPGGEASDALAFLDRAVTFPSSMVDRIVPATTPQLRNEVGTLLGARDEIPVPGEPFSMWAIEDRFAGGRPAWEAGGAVFTDEVGRYEQMKVRLLNGTHSLIAYLGALRGVATIPEAIGLGGIEDAARSVMRREYEPSVEVPTGVDIREYEGQLFARWGNSALGHRTSQVGSDGSVKLRQRIPEPALQALGRGEMPHLIALTVAGYLSCLAPLPGFDPGIEAAAMTDSARERLAAFSATVRDGGELALRVITDLQLFGTALAHQDAFIARVGELVDMIRTRGVDAAITDAVSASSGTSSALTTKGGRR
ncbi:mannitol dehydrogenase family protein [Microbacterium jiangjiandongii]|uniref:mannitol dehydrogenase family protein n=1 Tax=Microbacterium jiangjiandongii TaxID=3049071 RepID=UPI00214CCA72|nr:mannitol dehydrogenase family protein [Microbacterium sp. zg.Y843]MCR2816879.1 mannitol dehydrogenase family protein [Microbacterium sp. zg.Y843]